MDESPGWGRSRYAALLFVCALHVGKVYVFQDCYQMSKSNTSITNATNTGVAIQTYCNRRSKETRAYKRLHPDK
jgi:hypothetical protein